MIKKIRKKYEHTKKYKDEYNKRNDISFRGKNEFKEFEKDVDFLKLHKLLEGEIIDANNNLYVLRLKYLFDPKGKDSLKKFIDVYKSNEENANIYGSRPLDNIDDGLKLFELIDGKGRLTERGYGLIKTLSSIEQ